jgi:hypothetical protein
VYELEGQTELGSLQVDKCAVVELRLLANQRNLLAATVKGDIFALRLESHRPLKVELARVVESMDRIWELKIAAFEAMSTWGFAAAG